MDKSLDEISAPLLFLQDKNPTRSEKERAKGKEFLMQQKRKRGNACVVLLASSSQVARDYAGIGAVEEADHLLHCVCEMDEDDEWMVLAHTWNAASPGELSTLDWKNGMQRHLENTRHTCRNEIPVKWIVDKMYQEYSAQGTDGDEVMMTKDGQTFSKFSKEALEIGAAVSSAILQKVRNVFNLNKGDNEVFRTKNGAPKIMTKFG
jgi:hypothetical protein